jgi:hypothetical protein
MQSSSHRGLNYANKRKPGIQPEALPCKREEVGLDRKKIKYLAYKADNGHREKRFVQLG